MQEQEEEKEEEEEEEQQQQQQQQEHAQECDKKDPWHDDYKLRFEKNITLCSAPARTGRAHDQHQRSHYYT